MVWASDDGGYAVVRLRTLQGEVTAVGALAMLADESEEAAFVAIEGKWEEHAVHGRQFRSTGFLQGLPRTELGLTVFLSQAGIRGVGKKTSEAIVEHFGIATLRIISEEPQRLLEVNRVRQKQIDAITAKWEEAAKGAALAIRLRGLGMPARTVHRIRERYGDRALSVVSREPYLLAEEIPGVGFRTADSLAREQGLPLDDPARIRAAAVYALERGKNDGHTFLDRSQLTAAVRALSVPTDTLDAALDGLSMDRRVIVEPALATDDPFALAPPHPGDRVYRPDLWRAEVEVAEGLAARVEPAPDGHNAEELVDRCARFEGVDLGSEQRDAVLAAIKGGLAVVTGGPGTGKTTLLKVLLRVVRERGEQWHLASPTGRAARRLEEATGQTASTLHRLLEYRPGEGGFQRNRSRPLEGQGLVIDEVSMVDIELMHAVLSALPDGPFTLILVGDADQLPSVGPGQVLRDMIASGVVPVARLSRVYRQGRDSGILQAAGAIRSGQVPNSGERSDYDDCFLLERTDVDKAVETVLAVVSERLPLKGFDAMSDVQVLTPTRRGPLGTEGLNRVLQDRLNPDGREIKRGNKAFRVGDRVICTRNRYDVEVFNGDTGRVIQADATGLLIEFDGRMVPWSWDELGSLELAYAITVHKSQGSEYPAVVLVLHSSHGIMLRRNLFYTASTRASRFLCVIGARRAWGRAVSESGGDERSTRLAPRLVALFAADEEAPR